MSSTFKIVKTKLKKDYPCHTQYDDLRYIFSLFYKQAPGIIHLYQDAYRYYSDEYKQARYYQETFDNMAEMKRRIFKQVEENAKRY